jgi:hypothetical protein
MVAMFAPQFHDVLTLPVLLYHRPKMVTEMEYTNKYEEWKTLA